MLAKVVNIYPSPKYEHCLLMVFDYYVSLLPSPGQTNASYLRPKANFLKSGMWFIDAPVGINKLQSIIKDLCHAGGISGHFTNHSLRVTAVTHMYNSGVDEQVISQVTCHRLLCIRSYKKTSSDQKCQASHSLFQPLAPAGYSINEIANKHV